MATNYIGTGTFLANTTVTAFYGVVISNNRGVGLSTSTACDGFAQIDAASGDYVTVAFLTSFGTQKEWITSTVRTLMRTGRPAGMTSSLPVTSAPLPSICSFGYSNLNHHW